MAEHTTPVPGTSSDLGAFVSRHVGSDPRDTRTMLDTVGCDQLADLMDKAMPADIRSVAATHVEALSESDALAKLWKLSEQNTVVRTCIGMGYHDVVLPPVILRSVFENPCWYTQYTPYQSEISQGRLEALLNYQTMVCDLTGLPVANASLLDEATAAAEAMVMCRRIAQGDRTRFVVSDQCHPQTLAVLRGRAEPLGMELVVVDLATSVPDLADCCGVLVQSPDTRGTVKNWSSLAKLAKDAGAVPVMIADPMSLTIMTPPGEMG
ncbi:MAG: glycine dehydrogenase (aminomethyl-transferring), partial [Phycisphaerae bacterium]|nr:glycine dehydrogenase (aminomethyl-transferring) [Phycisphaerae bacterium]